MMLSSLQSTFLKEFFKYLGWILLFLFLWFNGCSKEKAVASATVVVPEVKGKFEAKNPVNVPIKANSPQLKTSTEPKNFSTEPSPLVQNLILENDKLKSDFAKASDSIKKLQFAKAVRLNNFYSNFENDDIKIDINGIVQGEVKEVTPSYTIKEKKVEVTIKPKETVVRVLAGMELGNNTKLDGFASKANLMLQNRKGNVLSASFDTNQTIWVGYNFSILNIKR